MKRLNPIKKKQKAHSMKKSKTFYVTIYHPDGSRFGSFEYKAETPEAALEKAKIYMAREWEGIEIYRAVVKEKRNPQVLLDRIVSQENGPTDEEKELEDERFQAFMRDWKVSTEEAEVRKESLNNFFEEERNPFEDEEEKNPTKDYCADIIVPWKYNIRYWVEAVSPEHALELTKVYVANETDIREDYIVKIYDTFEHGPVLEEDIHWSNEKKKTINDIANATNLFRAANELIQISKQLTEVANSLLTYNKKD